MLELVSGTDAQRELFQDAVNRWWQPTMHFFGPPSKQKDMLLYWGIKTRTNESLRQEFFSTYVPKLWDLGVTRARPRAARGTRQPASGTGPSPTGTSSGRS